MSRRRKIAMLGAGCSGLSVAWGLCGHKDFEVTIAARHRGGAGRERRTGDCVQLHGLLPRPAVRRMMAAADIFCLPSVPTRQGKCEGIPVVLMEAMASGVPVLSSRLSGIPELVEDGIAGILVEPRDSTALAAAIEMLAGDPGQRARLGQAGRRQVESHFNLHTNARHLAGLFARQTPAPASRPDAAARQAVGSGSA